MEYNGEISQKLATIATLRNQDYISLRHSIPQNLKFSCLRSVQRSCNTALIPKLLKRFLKFAEDF